MKWEVLWRKKKACGTLREKNPEGRSELPKEEGDAVRGYKAMHDENVLSSWLRSDLTGKERKVNERVGEEVENKRKRGGKEKIWGERGGRDGENKVCQF